jgi:hypothetical protein
MIDREEELHEQLMDAFRAYFKANQEWHTKGTRRAGIKTRNWLSEIRRICKERRKVIQEWRYDVDEEKQARKNQNSEAEGSDDDN